MVSYFGTYRDSEDGRNAGDVTGGPIAPRLYPAYSGKALLDLELGIPLDGGVSLALGAQNILNSYPDINIYGAQTVGNQYGQFSPFGFNGAYYYVRINYGWGSGSF